MVWSILHARVHETPTTSWSVHSEITRLLIYFEFFARLISHLIADLSAERESVDFSIYVGLFYTSLFMFI